MKKFVKALSLSLVMALMVGTDILTVAPKADVISTVVENPDDPMLPKEEQERIERESKKSDDDFARERLAKEAEAEGFTYVAKIIRASKNSTPKACENLLNEARLAKKKQDEKKKTTPTTNTNDKKDEKTEPDTKQNPATTQTEEQKAKEALEKYRAIALKELKALGVSDLMLKPVERGKTLAGLQNYVQTLEAELRKNKKKSTPTKPSTTEVSTQTTETTTPSTTEIGTQTDETVSEQATVSTAIASTQTETKKHRVGKTGEVATATTGIGALALLAGAIVSAKKH